VLRANEPTIRGSNLLNHCHHENCIVTLGSLGAIGKLEGVGCIRLNSNKRTIEAINTIGSGDIFSGIFLSAKIQGYDLKECFKLAGIGATISVQSLFWDTWMERFSSLKELEKSDNMLDVFLCSH